MKHTLVTAMVMTGLLAGGTAGAIESHDHGVADDAVGLEEEDPSRVAEEKIAIATVLRSLAVSADREDFDALEGLYWEQVEMDYTSLSGGEPEIRSPKAIVSEWASVLPGFDRTHHKINDVIIEVTGDRARATCSIVAKHWIDELYWQVAGEYRFTLRKHKGDWRITGHTFLLREEEGTRDALGPAMENAAARTPAYLAGRQTDE